MFFYGISSRKIGGETIFPKCDHCGKTNSVEIEILQRYFHVFWIPLIPLYKKGRSFCHSCHKPHTAAEFDQLLKEEYKAIRARTITPRWMFIGLILLGALIIFATIYFEELNVEEKARIEAPLKGDEYSIKEAEDRYTLYKVTQVDLDSVWVVRHTQEVEKGSQLLKIQLNNPDAFDTIPFRFSNMEIKKMYEEKIIRNVSRKN